MFGKSMIALMATAGIVLAAGSAQAASRRVRNCTQMWIRLAQITRAIHALQRVGAFVIRRAPDVIASVPR